MVTRRQFRILARAKYSASYVLAQPNPLGDAPGFVDQVVGVPGLDGDGLEAFDGFSPMSVEMSDR